MSNSFVLICNLKSILLSLTHVDIFSRLSPLKPCAIKFSLLDWRYFSLKINCHLFTLISVAAPNFFSTNVVEFSLSGHVKQYSKIWLKYGWYNVKHHSINQSIIQLILTWNYKAKIAIQPDCIVHSDREQMSGGKCMQICFSDESDEFDFGWIFKNHQVYRHSARNFNI